MTFIYVNMFRVTSHNLVTWPMDKNPYLLINFLGTGYWISVYQKGHICIHTNNQRGGFFLRQIEQCYYNITNLAVKLYECIDVGILRKESLVIRHTSYIEKVMACSKIQTDHIIVLG